eukprot:m.173953 g.173953  ORF g.173953 m.173953 type:complete len:349 (+) comp31747_c0_seq3:138-1184(+)
MSLVAWLVEHGVSGDEASLIAPKLEEHGFSEGRQLADVHTEDLAGLVPKVGHRYLIRNAGVTAVHAAASNSEEDLAPIRARITAVRTTGDVLRRDLEVITQQLQQVEGDLMKASAEVKQYSFASLSAQDQKREQADLMASLSAEVEQLKIDVITAQADTQTALAEKEFAINHAINAGVAAQQVSSIQLPSLDDFGSKKTIKKKVEDTSWKKKMQWYVRGETRDNCEKRVVHKQCANGAFLVRDSTNAADSPYSLTVRFPGAGKTPEAKHFRVLKTSEGYRLALKGNPDSFQTLNLPELIAYYMNVGVGSGVTLTAPAPPLPNSGSCPKCFGKVIEGRKFCNSCGFKLV